MTNDTRPWVRKAEEDWRVIDVMLHVDPPGADTATFHAQQCAEKYIKALLVERGRVFPKTHDLAALLDLCPTPPIGFDAIRRDLEWLTSLAVRVRYPDCFADEASAVRAQAVAANVRTICRRDLGLDAD